MKLPCTAAEVLRDHVTLRCESIDRMYLNVFVPSLQRLGGVLGFLQGHLGHRLASTAMVADRSKSFLASIDKFASTHGIDVVTSTAGAEIARTIDFDTT